jgi:hypothetical protein
VAQADFDAMAANQMDRTRKVTGALAFNDAAYEGVEVKVHGGQYQRRGVDKPSFRLKVRKTPSWPRRWANFSLF